MTRTHSLSRERIVEAAAGLLDADGEAGLTFRSLAARLETGAGALYWHVASKDELLAAATEQVVTTALAKSPPDASPKKVIRAVALALFDAIDEHPWVGTQLARNPVQGALLQIYERFGAQLQALKVPKRSLFVTASTVVSYVLGVASQNAANARNAVTTDREAYLAEVAAELIALDPVAYPFLREMAAQLRDHDDREQFLAGVDLILAGIAASR